VGSLHDFIGINECNAPLGRNAASGAKYALKDQEDGVILRHHSPRRGYSVFDN